MENKQIALVVLLILIGIFIVILSLKLYSFFKFIENKQNDGISYRKFSLNLYEQIIPLEKSQSSNYGYMKLIKDNISYQKDESEQLVYKFQIDKNNNWKCCKYHEKDNRITISDIYSDEEYRPQGQSKELIYFSNIQMDKNQTYFYNQKITQQELKNGSISVLNAYLMYLNHYNWDKFLQKDFQRINILFLPSYILDQSHMKNSSVEEIKKYVQQQYQQFLFQFQPINFKIELLYESVYFTYESDKNLQFIEVDFQQSIINVHCIWFSAQKEEYYDISNILSSFLFQGIEKIPSICNFCKPNNDKGVRDYYKGCEIAFKYSQFNHPIHHQNAEGNPLQNLKSHIQQHILKI
ncbi:unnamed protein product (macronuclear) [Paramecium tetraurelia]|uniref:Transmembrane protein n=1 Tax=Paramecium tetraurelia TaxID=5888 RepID=A0BN49_PARTE|nr:uncharacterized protein GSPATT00030604001 [Paramecium tetraurelia]CAK59966.1 unnamed protein product [Paramecium tetraurelia]|eukprot:XP_001427364.1 hypothetical protein (macronuclear) [Paramecium tetraurelia strain d4-2]